MKMTMMRITGLLALVLCVAVAVCARGLSLRPVGGPVCVADTVAPEDRQADGEKKKPKKKEKVPEAATELTKEQKAHKKSYEKNHKLLFEALRKSEAVLGKIDTLHGQTDALSAQLPELRARRDSVTAAFARQDTVLSDLIRRHKYVVDELTDACRPLLRTPLEALDADSVAEALLAAETVEAKDLQDDLLALRRLVDWNAHCLTVLGDLVPADTLAVVEAEGRRLLESPRLAEVHQELLRQRLAALSDYREDLVTLRSAVVAVVTEEKFREKRAAANDQFSWNNLKMRFEDDGYETRFKEQQSKLRTAALRRVADEFRTEVVKRHDTRLESFFQLVPAHPAAASQPRP